MGHTEEKNAAANDNRPKHRYSPPRICLSHLKFRRDWREKLPRSVSRFTGYRPLDENPPYPPLPFPPFTWLAKLPLCYETWLLAWIGAFIGILLIEAIMSTSTAFRDVYHAPTIITSFGASAVLLFGVIESPVAQPRNFVLGHFLSALVGTAITRLFMLNGSYHGYLDNVAFHPSTFINGGVSMATSLLVMLITGTAHPPAGATGLNAAVQSQIVTLSWRYLPTVLASSLIMLGWALVINNVGRRRYPLHWWAPGPVFVIPPEEQPDAQLGAQEEAQEEVDIQREVTEEGSLRAESDPSETITMERDGRREGSVYSERRASLHGQRRGSVGSAADGIV
ncbi:hypothetical protein DTO166G4_7242 [Paecilomyces variotii]|nr:hypothetical protein DTO166G4_7242 [Paecilomyces variotii]KAJ9230214.1 hypothetical protein DTO166G5_7471 [Paecilomyces variotii]